MQGKRRQDKANVMDTILIVGHPQSGHHDLERLLHAAGMATAHPSKREGLDPVSLGTVLCDAHTPAPKSGEPTATPLEPISVSPVWHGLAMDLMLANVHQPVWGWSDPAAVRLLQFWHDIHPELQFVLVYDTPGELLVSACQTLDPARDWPQIEATLAQGMAQWRQYHEALLAFYLRHTRRCLLVQRQQVRHAPDQFLALLQDRTTAPWSSPPPAMVSDTDTATGAKDSSARLLTRWVADAVTDHFPAARQLYEELQLSASLPHGTAPGTDRHALWQVWRDLGEQLHQGRHQRQEISRQADQISQLTEQQLAQAQHLATTEAASLEQLACLSTALQTAETNQRRQDRQLRRMEQVARARQGRIQRLAQHIREGQRALDQSRTVLTRQARVLEQREQKQEQERQTWQRQSQAAEQRTQALHAAIEHARAQADEHIRNASDLALRLDTVRQDREHLLTQLHQVQEALATQHASHRTLSQQLVQRQNAEQLASTRQRQIDTLDQQLRERQDAVAKAQALAAQSAQEQAALAQRLRTVEQARESLERQLQQVQEALATQHTQQRQLTERLEQLPPLEQLARERARRIEQLDQQVSTQSHARELSEARAAELQTRLQEEASAHQSLYQSLAEDHARLVAQLHRVQQALERQHHTSAPNPAQTAPSVMPSAQALLVPTPIPDAAPATAQDEPAAAFFGAAERVKAQLSYRLGATLIQHSRSVGGWLCMPFAVVATVVQFEREKAQRRSQKLPPIHQYRDAHEAERVRGHLSYRLGSVLIRNAQSPLGWGRMPFAVQREIRAFRTSQRT